VAGALALLSVESFAAAADAVVAVAADVVVVAAAAFDDPSTLFGRRLYLLGLKHLVADSSDTVSADLQAELAILADPVVLVILVVAAVKPEVPSGPDASARRYCSFVVAVVVRSCLTRHKMDKPQFKNIKGLPSAATTFSHTPRT